MDLELVIGNKNYSSWSLRPWLFLSYHAIPIKETRIPLYALGSKERIASYSKAGMVPILIDGDVTVHDSLAICEYVSDAYLDGRGWPQSRDARAVARSVSAEMHSGFANLRQHLSMNLRARFHWQTINDDVERDIARIVQIWDECRARFAKGKPWLFGEFSIADAMFAPVCTRFKSYNVPMTASTAEYVEQMLALPSMQAWYTAARAEKEVIGWTENARLLRIEDALMP